MFLLDSCVHDSVVLGHNLNQEHHINHSNEQLITLALQVNLSNSHVKASGRWLIRPHSMQKLRYFYPMILLCKGFWTVFLALTHIVDLSRDLFQSPWVFGSLQKKVSRGWKQDTKEVTRCSITCGREIKRCCSFPAALHLSRCRKCASLNKYISSHFLDLRAWNACSSSGIGFQSHMLWPRTIL